MADSRISAKNKNHSKMVLGNDFYNKGAVSLQTLVIPIDMAERVSKNSPSM
jgi:hypothetical protein